MDTQRLTAKQPSITMSMLNFQHQELQELKMKLLAPETSRVTNPSPIQQNVKSSDEYKLSDFVIHAYRENSDYFEWEKIVILTVKSLMVVSTQKNLLLIEQCLRKASDPDFKPWAKKTNTSKGTNYN